MSNLRHCRRRNEAMADKYCKFGFIYQVRFEHVVVQGAKKNFIWFTFSFKNFLQWNNFTSKNHNTYFSTIWRKFLKFVNLCETVKVYELKDLLRLYATLHTIPPLLVHENASHCSKISKEIIRRFYDIKWLSCLS